MAWGGMFYALADAPALGFRLTPDEGRDLVRVGEMVKAAAREQIPVAHPEQPELAGISIMEWTGPPSVPGADAKNTVVVSSGTLDWEPPASFTACSIARRAAPAPVPGWRCCTRVASWRSARTSCTRGSWHHLDWPAAAPTATGPYPAVVPQLTGSAWITGRTEYCIDDEDPFPRGYGRRPVGAHRLRVRARMRMDR